MRIFTVVSFRDRWEGKPEAEIEAVGPWDLLGDYVDELLSQGWQEISPRYSNYQEAFLGLSTVRQFTRTEGDAGRQFIGIDHGRMWRAGSGAGRDTWCGRCKRAYWNRIEQIWETFPDAPVDCDHYIREGGW